MLSKNCITGDNLVSKVGNQGAYAEGYDRIWGKEEPSSYSQPIILSNKIQCNRCNDVIESKNRHDFVLCKCESVGVDGGTDYLRRIGDPEDYTDLSEVTSEEVDNWFERVREVFTWHSYGKDGKGTKKQTLLKDLETEHIRAILETQWHIRGSDTEDYMKKELEWRKEHHES